VFVAPGDPAATAAALRRLADDPAEVARLGAAARARAEADYTPARVVGAVRAAVAGVRR
jgi:glycosyltransferase involved in cell wall biosynthesis